MDVRDLSDEKLAEIIESAATDDELFAAADGVRRQIYGTDVYIRGLIEFSNYCKNDCFYCGIRRKNAELSRYRLSPDEIFACCDTGYALGFRTFVLQSGEDPFFDDETMCKIIATVKKKYPDCALTLSVGEKSFETYTAFFEAGADRYLLRHETADNAHYALLHPENLDLQRRKECLFDLKKIGFQVGAGFMVGSPYQTVAHIVKDLRFLQELAPAMIGIGPFIPHEKTPFAEQKSGTLALTLRLIAILRLLFPYALIPATTALGSIAENGRELGLKAGANVVMPNLSPVSVRKRYALYDGKICTGEEAAECRGCLERRVLDAGYKIVVSRGDVKN